MTGSRLATALLTGTALVVLAPGIAVAAAVPGETADPAERVAAAKPLEGKVIVLDPGHQLGNHNFPRRIKRLVPAGGFSKPCNTTGTATNGGYPEASFTWDVALRLRERLQAQGAVVRMTRHSNRQDRWGPCVDERGLAGNVLANGAAADLKISIHGDGSWLRGARGFHVIMPADRSPWTDDIYDASRELALATRDALVDRGLTTATYIAGGDGLDVRRDLGTLNLSDIPTVMVELGNMRNRSDATRMTRPRGREHYARALALAVRRYVQQAVDSSGDG
jgi:N-acetylmuramoyl-L-alanine amidase